MSVTVPDVPAVEDDLVNNLVEKIVEGINEIVEANKTLIAADEAGAGLREIDKALKEYIKTDKNTEELENLDDEKKEVAEAVNNLERARKAFKTSLKNARNLYRKNVLHEEEIPESEENEVDEAAVKARRVMVMKAVELLKGYASMNPDLKVIESWCGQVSVPQVGRQGSSSVGQRKPRAYVTVNDTTHDSFGVAAKALTTLLSTDDKKVEVTSNDLVVAWDEAGTDEFEFMEQKIKVAEKEKGTKKSSSNGNGSGKEEVKEEVEDVTEALEEDSLEDDLDEDD